LREVMARLGAISRLLLCRASPSCYGDAIPSRTACTSWRSCRCTACGARLGTIDVRATPTTDISDSSWIVRPGSDMKLALYLCHEAILLYGKPAAPHEGYEAFATACLQVSAEDAQQATGLSAEALHALVGFIITSRLSASGPAMAFSAHTGVPIWCTLSMHWGSCWAITVSRWWRLVRSGRRRPAAF